MNAHALCLALFVAFVAAAKPHPKEEMARLVNKVQSGWKAKASMGKKDVSAHLGLDWSMEKSEFRKLPTKPTLLGAADPPASFDGRDEWPQCTTIGLPRDQSECGSCWAFGSTEAFNDRMCISSGDTTTILSPEDTMECVHVTSHGCNGGSISGAWNYFKSHGVPSGDNQASIGDGKTCKPYVFESCWHHEATDQLPSCDDISPPSDGPDAMHARRLEGFNTPKCTRECSEEGYGIAYADDLTKASAVYSIRGVDDIMTELSTNGPVTAAFTVYEDFEMYTSGVYKHTTGKSLGGHAIKLIGYGTDADSGLDYWLAVNSWNDTWGDGGLFKIAKGINECGIESNVVAGMF